MSNLIASVFTGIGLMFSGIFGGGHANVAATNPPVQPPHAAWEGSTTASLARMMPMMRNGVVGIVAAIDGTTITVDGRQGMSAATTTYSVDASGARIIKGPATTTASISSVSVNDRIVVQGTVSGDSIKATMIIDGIFPMMGAPGSKGFGQRGMMASSTRGFRGGMRNPPGAGDMPGQMNPGGPMQGMQGMQGGPAMQGGGDQNGGPVPQ